MRDLIVVGAALPFRVLDADGRLLLNEGQVVGSERQFEALIERGAWVERPRVEQVRRERSGGSGAAVSPAVRQATLFDRWEKAVWDLDDLYRRLGRGRAAAHEVASFAAALQVLIERDPEVALFQCVRQDDRRFALYAMKHGLHCAVVGLLLARQLEWAAPGCAALMAASLTMNVSMAELQAQLAEQGEPPTLKQSEQIRAHPLASAKLLQAAGVTDAAWLAMVTEHHERDDGKGYPRGLVSVSAQARVLRAVDVFMAKISPRAKRAPMTPQAAARQLFQQPGGAPLATALIHAVGVHPPGTLVQLKSGEVGVVTRRPSAGPAPMVATLTNAKGQPIPATHHRDTTAAEFGIVQPLAEAGGLPKILPERVYGMIMA